MEFMTLQMKNEAEERAHERREGTEDRRQMQEMLSTVVTGFFSYQMEKSVKSKSKKKKCKRKEQMGSSDSSSSDDSDKS